MNVRAPLRLCLTLLLLAGLAGCATPYRSGPGDGVYYERPTRSVGVAYVDPLLYPFWSLDYFYYSRYYHPYSVLVNRYDPWYYPYPGWYYGYHPGRHHVGHRGRLYYPWNRYGSRYAGYQPWRTGVHLSFSYTYGFGDFGWRRPERDLHRVRDIDARLNELQTRRSFAIRSQRPDRDLVPVVQQRFPVTHRRGVGGASLRRDTPQYPRQIDRRDRGARAGLLERLRSADRGLRRLDPSPVPRPSTRPDRSAPVLRIGDGPSRSAPVERPSRPVSRPTRPTRDPAPTRREAPPTRSRRPSSPPPQRGNRNPRRIDRNERD
jgi:hypothetical protein